MRAAFSFRFSLVQSDLVLDHVTKAWQNSSKGTGDLLQILQRKKVALVNDQNSESINVLSHLVLKGNLTYFTWREFEPNLTLLNRIWKQKPALNISVKLLTFSSFLSMVGLVTTVILRTNCVVWPISYLIKVSLQSYHTLTTKGLKYVSTRYCWDISQ